jgi:4-amino-4-deoxy-L-arabinose transferase-like glycosyltransferase
MISRTATALIAATIVIAGTLLYTTALDQVPPYLIHDEAQGALQAHSIATTGRDLSGRLLPLYFTEPEFPPGRDPVMIYVTALGLEVLPFTEAGARTPTTLIAVLNLVLMFFAARALFESTWAGVLAAVMLALMPVHFIRGRLLLSPLYSIPFVLGWLWALGRFERQPSARRLVAACAWLALGMYSYLAAVVMMPLYLLMTLGVAARSLRWRGPGLAAATFALCLLPMAAWYATHPERNAQIVSAYQLRADEAATGLTSATAAAGKYLNLYWRFFDPAYLFTSGDSSLINSTRTSGLFPLAFALLLPIGLLALWRRRTPIAWVMIAGFLAAPAVSVISGAIEMNRVMFVIPFAVLVATAGAMALWQSRSVAPRALAAALVLSIGWQFSGFHGAYISDGYRLQSATWFSGNVREALRELIARSGDAPIYISSEIEWVHRMWRFYAIEAGRLDLIPRATYVSDPPATAAAGSKLLCPEDSRLCSALTASGAWQRVVVVPSIDGMHRYAILERTAGGQAN